MLLSSKFVMESCEGLLVNKPNNHINHKVFSSCFELILIVVFFYNCSAYH